MANVVFGEEKKLNYFVQVVIRDNTFPHCYCSSKKKKKKRKEMKKGCKKNLLMKE